MKALSSRALVRASIVLASAVAASAAHADHKLFPTDVLTSGEVDASVGLSRVEHKQDDAPNAKISDKAGSLTGRVGVGESTHLSFSLARVDRTITSDASARESSNATSYKLGVQHALLTEGPVTLAIGAGFSHQKETGVNATTALAASLSLGFKAPRDIRPYATVAVSVPDEDAGGGTEWTLEAGAWVPVHARVTVIPFVTIENTRQSHGSASTNGGSVPLGANPGASSNVRSMGVSALVQVTERAYVKPTLGYAVGDIADIDGKRTTAAISLYYKY